MRLSFLSFIFFYSILLNAQTPCPDCPPDNPNSNQYDVIRIDERTSKFDFVPGDIIVKFRNEAAINLGKTSGFITTGYPSTDIIFRQYKIVSAARVFAGETKPAKPEYFKSFSGQKVEIPSLHNIYKISTGDSHTNIFEVIEALKQDVNVEYAEPNYILSIVESMPLSPELTEPEMIKWLSEHHELFPDNKSPNRITSVVPNDPLYSQQWGIPAAQVDAVWNSTKGDTTQIIAILDTGVDWLHPDLKNKIWTNPGEIPDNGIDDDNNGYVDDVRGWDWINNDNDPRDDNSHGTHVAGITAAESNNGIGVAGVNWHAKVMPLKVFQSSGRGDLATITRGIIYAHGMGADIINMSFGSYTASLTLEAALANAYGTSILVAAAGNDSRCIGPGSGCARFFPAAYSFVLGIEATDESGLRADFSNVDTDGPVYSAYKELSNYELKAPGALIISAVPNGGYRALNGTSMAAPLVSGGISLYRQLKPGENPELMWAKLIASSEENIKLYNSLNYLPPPQVNIVGLTISDSIPGNDIDGRVDAGETIELWYRLRNTGGACDSTFMSIQLGEFEDTLVAKILRDKISVGSMSSYATRDAAIPLLIKVSENAPHGRDIVFNLKLWWNGAADTTRRTLVITPENGEELYDVLDSTRILYPNRNYIVNQSFKIGVGGRLIIKPGTQITFYPGKSIPISGELIADGTPDSMIVFKAYIPPGSSGPVSEIFVFRNFEYNIKNRFSYCVFENFRLPLAGGGQNPASIFNCKFISDDIAIGYADSVVDNTIRSFYDGLWSSSYVKRNNFISPTTTGSFYAPSGGLYSASLGNYYYNNMINLRMPTNEYFDHTDPNMQNNWISEYYKYKQVWNGTFYEDAKIYLEKFNTNGTADFQYMQHQYWGTSDSLKIENMVYDFKEDPLRPRIRFSPFLKAPTDSAHGVLWKIHVNGKDPFDDAADPVGVGKHRFDIYYSKAMDTSFTPTVSFGVRYPFLTNFVNEDGFWSANRRIYTVYKTVKIQTGDGINRIRVTGGKDTDGWDIPDEDMRFEFLIDAAGSASAEFQATAGLGKVYLEWSTPPELTDLLGYNIYRFDHLTDTTFTDPVLINNTLINDTLYTDFEVIPNKKYYYYYKVVRTDFSESDSSRIVSSIPLTASRGDANGDLTVNVLDITTMVSYLLNQNPQPFIFEAADVNQDNLVNVLDIVGTVNIIMGSGNINKESGEGAPVFTFDAKGAYLAGGSSIAGLQFRLTGKDIKDANIIAGPLASGMEMAYSITGDTINIIFYSFYGNTIKSDEKDLLFRISKGHLTKLETVTAGNRRGEQINVQFSNDGFIIPTEYVLYQNYPNPFNPETVIRYGIPEDAGVELSIYNIMGEKIWEQKSDFQKAGYYELRWHSVNLNRQPVSSGVYIYQLKAGNFISQKKMVLVR
ncbi:MAG: S8 family serine peptidase [Ignavibacteriaceae bacterium]|nr:S8 family serine peptidase [Ignavibacteriaceae bacterium]